MNIWDSLPSDKEVLYAEYGIDKGPVGIYLEPAIAGFSNNAPGVDEDAFLSRRSIFEEFDATTIERPQITVIESVGKAVLSNS